ncbi:PepSY-associated TM helix domain protein [Chthoniobacter flavus Ellin428]|uniref:PepSY-associated TM helix domain protein n=1 Tax=Chthoniobacter flavus Ellin428 TaxID=497964 RepID=B4CVS2_9BACT|nr:PepSY-associated TM helix domain-containing protein [Chthoniobacter flavus]EDY21514.1 PepSY-associated TM helix domain protein [Chthoniobacter flavus Ellin428]TCO95464.1 putative iron-regulated membrane protein [Chthoniobacter flavus]
MIRKLVFWTHLAAGLVTGFVVFTLCLTGALITFDRQILNWAERDARALPPSSGAERVSPATLVAGAAKLSASRVTNLEWFADPKMPVRVYFEDRSVALFNSWTGEALGRGAVSLRAFFRGSTEVHVNLTMSRTGKWVVDAANAAFVFLTLSGLWIWWPRQWRWKALRSSLAIRFDAGGKARDWNWHNALGFWFLLPLLIIAASGLVLSFKPVDLWWRDFGGKHLLAEVKPPAPAPAANGASSGWNGVMALVQQQYPGWRWMMTSNSLRGGHINIMVGTGSFGQRALVHTVTVDVAANTIVKTSAWENDIGGNRARAIARLGHTGEIVGLWGQWLAFMACLVGLVLVYTGFALSWRRFFPRRAGVG